MTSHSARLLTSYYGVTSLDFQAWGCFIMWPNIQTSKVYVVFKRRMRCYLFPLKASSFLMTTFMTFFELARILPSPFCFWSKGEEHQGISLIFTRSEAPVFRTFFWTFLVVSSIYVLKNLCSSTAAFSVVVKGGGSSSLCRVSQSSGWMATLVEICDIGHDWRVCVHIVAKMDTKVLQSSSWVFTATVFRVPPSFYFMECQILTQLAVY